LGAFFALQNTGLSAPIPHKPPRGLLRDFRFYPLRGPKTAIPAAPPSGGFIQHWIWAYREEAQGGPYLNW
jgi:hypothetical protein